MSNIGNKETFAKNLNIYMNKSGKSQRELAEIVGVAASTFNDWAKAKKYPRIDKIEMLANYFGILKSDLIEEHVEPEEQAAFDAMLLRDSDLMEIMKKYVALSDKNKKAVKQMIDSLSE